MKVSQGTFLLKKKWKESTFSHSDEDYLAFLERRDNPDVTIAEDTLSVTASKCFVVATKGLWQYI